MTRSFGLVDEKIAEADFFLEQLGRTGANFFTGRCYFSAFVSAARSVTFALQAVMNDLEGFKEWYETKQQVLRNDPVARYFNRIRTELQHVGATPVNAGTYEQGEDGIHRAKYFFSGGIGKAISDAPDMDVVTACQHYLTEIVKIVFDCYRQFGTVIDPDRYYELENLEKLGLSIEDIEASLGFPRGWTYVPGSKSEDRLKALRRHIPSTDIDIFFQKYLNRGRLSGDDTG